MKIRSYLLLMIGAIIVPVFLLAAIALRTLLQAEREAALHTLSETASATACWSTANWAAPKRRCGCWRARRTWPAATCRASTATPPAPTVATAGAPSCSRPAASS
ncbi:hypothetical protein [Massilia sp. YIM B02443]|uniref:hypothetical protein n=1 Tax=Massilia sp. YIM B02443 TaxID=3050127 RepID=UPI0025B68767|nr:hypothetical protein [Massilia sp. YIM B02443]MDN4035450.1 hypothetical protein [Massilia sp. YIM B02443]